MRIRHYAPLPRMCPPSFRLIFFAHMGGVFVACVSLN